MAPHIITVIEDGGLEALRTHLEAAKGDGASLINTPDSDGQLPLVWCALSHLADAKEVAQVLLEHGADVNALAGRPHCQYTWAALMSAADQLNVEMVKLFLDSGADADLRGADADLRGAEAEGAAGPTALMFACNQSKINMKTEYKEAHIEIVRLLVSRMSHASLDALDGMGRTALMQYAMIADDCCEAGVLLMDAGSKLDAFDMFGDSGLTLTIANRNEPLSAAFIQHGAPLGVRRNTSRLASMRTARLLSESGDGAKREEDDEASQEHPLHVACTAGALAIITLLLEKGVPADDLDADGEKTALHTFCECTDSTVAALHEEVITALLEHGASINAVTTGVRFHQKATPLHLASYCGHADVTEFLVEKGARIDALDESDKTPLMHAAAEGKKEAVERLIELGASLTHADNEGKTALVLACEESSHAPETIGTAYTLLRLGACIEDNAVGDTAGEMLAAGKLADHIKVLVEMEVEDIAHIAASAFLQATSPPKALGLFLRLADAAQRTAVRVRARDTSLADEYSALSVNLQLACGGLIAELGAEDGENDDDGQVQQLMRSRDGKWLLEFAVNASLKGFVSQPLVQVAVRREWRGRWLQTLLAPDPDDLQGMGDKMLYALSWLGFLLVLPLQVCALLPLVAIVPPAAEPLKMLLARACKRYHYDSFERSYKSVGRFFLFDDSPQLRYASAFIADVAVVVLLTLLGSGAFEGDVASDRALSAVLCFCAASSLMGEVSALIEDGLRAYLADFFNFADITFNLLTVIALAVRLHEASDGTTSALANATAVLVVDPAALDPAAFEAGPVARALLAFALLGMWLRLANVLQLFATTGPFVLMVFKMVRDVAVWIILYVFVLLGFAAAFVSLFSGPEPAGFDMLAADDGCIRPDDDLATFGRAVQLLWEGGLTGEAYFECVRSSSAPGAASALMYLFQIFVGLLMVNMLIAMMAKTFDNVAEAQEVNFMFLFAQTVAEWRKQSRSPPTVILLSLPWRALYALLCRLCRLHERVAIDDTDETYVLGGGWEEAHPKDELGETVAEYISGHADDVPAEDRWRTLFARKLTVHFEELRRQGEEANEKLDDRIDDIERSMAAIVRKLGVRVDTEKQSVMSRRSSRRQGGRGGLAGGAPSSEGQRTGGAGAERNLADATVAMTSAVSGASVRRESTTRASRAASRMLASGVEMPPRTKSIVSDTV